ncbi:MAG TPA: CoB--CoM heterodisulfide reductase iron-sulfur subunit A family protein [Anaerolineae bacterium]|nr:CoB--CoM heterodisulfide reductase iron-sulfur subunit A family protein [Anaerolineae bacterium]
MKDAGRHPNITLLTYSEVESVAGYVGNFVVRIRKRARSVKEDLCTGCGTCEENCPRRVVDTVYEAGLGYRTAIYRPFAQAVPAIPVIDRENCLYFTKGKCRICEKVCPTHAIDYTQEDTILEVEVGNIILATGFDPFDARRIPQFGYGRFPNVFTSLEIERMLSGAGPTGGKVVLRDGKTVPQRVAIIHCVGSRDKNFREYCSRVCCMYSLKLAHLIRHKTHAEVYDFYIDIRAPGKMYEEFYHRMLDEGIHFIRGKVAQVTDATRRPEEEGRLVVQFEDTLTGLQRRMPVDMVVLAIGLEPRHDSREVARLFGISTDADGWFKEKHPKLDPVATMTDGVFIAGCAQGPKDIPDSVAQGSAAAARVLSLIGQGEVEVEAATAIVDELMCVGCGQCIQACPYSAIEYLEDRRIAHVIEALCKGCGTCVGACPSKAITLRHFTDRQLISEMMGAMYAMRTELRNTQYATRGA